MEPVAPRTKSDVAFWLVVMGLVAACYGAAGMRRWSALAFEHKLCDVILLAAGLALLASGAWLLRNGARPRVAGMVGAGAAGVFAVTLAVGVWSHAIPCTGSS